jgi:hypothetical protein
VVVVAVVGAITGSALGGVNGIWSGRFRWRVYEEVVISGSGAAKGGMPDLAPCFQYVPDGSSRVVLRVRPAGTKLKAQFGERSGKSEPEFAPGGLSGYLHH